MAPLIAVKLLSGILEQRDARTSNSAHAPEPVLAAPAQTSQIHP